MRKRVFGHILVSIFYKSIVDRYRPVGVDDGPRTARCIFIKNANLDADIKDPNGLAQPSCIISVHCSLTDSLETTKYMNREHRSG